MKPINRVPRRAYERPGQSLEVEYEIKKSRFIARAAKAQSREEAMVLLAQAKLDYPDARHHCWAYLIGDPHSPSTAAMSDDGEPSGTAGKPILNVLQHKNVGDIMLIVIRYFGGVKLGAGGLVRAYSQSAQQVMTELYTETQTPMRSAVVSGSYALEQSLRHWLSSCDGRVTQVDYGECVACHVQLPDAHWQALSQYALSQGARLSDDDS
ncbi:MAG: YigZ family protein [Cellvibrionaceae bacterium]